ncbi:MAG: DUF4115 domain-containing protein [Acidimicrobiales bacterium]
MTKLVWRPNPDETHSVRDYTTALGTMRHVSERVSQLSGSAPKGPGGLTGPPAQVSPHSVHITDREAGESAHPVHPDPAAPPGTPRIGRAGSVPEVEGVPVFEDGVQPDPVDYTAVMQLAPEFRSERARKQVMHSMDHRERRGAMSVLVVVVVAAVGVLAYVGSHRSGHHAAVNPRSSIVSSQHPSAGPGRTAARVPKSSHRRSLRPRTTTTTRPPSRLVATSSTGATAVYPVGAGSYTVVITASGACWVDAIVASSGATAWTGTLQPGSSQVIHATGAMNVELGAFGATMSVDNVPVVFPTPYQAPFTAMFEPVSTGSPVSTVAPSSGNTAPQG